VPGIPVDRFDGQVKLVGAVHLASDTVEHVWLDGEAFGERVEPIDPAGEMVLREEDGTIAVFRPREQEQVGTSSMLSRQGGLCQGKFRILCRVPTASPPILAAFPQTPSEDVPPPASPLLRSPTSPRTRSIIC